MAYEWDLDENIKENIVRLIIEQINFAIAQLQDETANRDEAIHEARKAFKMVRAVLRLVRDEIGDSYFQEKNTFYRDLGRELAPIRDDLVVVETMDALILQIEDKNLIKSAKILRKQLFNDFQETEKTFWKSETVKNVIDALESERSIVDQIPIENESFKAFKKGMRRVYKRGCKRMPLAYANIPSAAGFHDWRKRVKYLWYQMRILEPIHPAQFTALIAQLDQLGELLGQAHDLAVLYERLEHYAETDDGAGRELLAYLDLKRGELEQSAKPFGNAIYEMKSKKFIKQVKHWWKNPKPIVA